MNWFKGKSSPESLIFHGRIGKVSASYFPWNRSIQEQHDEQYMEQNHEPMDKKDI